MTKLPNYIEMGIIASGKLCRLKYPCREKITEAIKSRYAKVYEIKHLCNVKYHEMFNKSCAICKYRDYNAGFYYCLVKTKGCYSVEYRHRGIAKLKFAARLEAWPSKSFWIGSNFRFENNRSEEVFRWRAAGLMLSRGDGEVRIPWVSKTQYFTLLDYPRSCTLSDDACPYKLERTMIEG